MKLEAKLEFKEMFGGDGIQRFIDVEKPTLSRTKKRTTKKADVGLERSTSRDEVLTELRKEPVNTFKMEDGKPIMRLGGIHGKCWGAMRAAGKLLNQLGDEDFASQAAVERMMQMVNISPVYVQLESNGTAMRQEGIPQIMAGFGKTMIVQLFDVIPQCTCSVTFEFPEHIERHVKKMLKQMESMALMNKRRAAMKILALKKAG